MEIKAVDAESGVFEGYGSVFGVLDSYQERVAAGAFRRSLSERGASGIKMLWQHRAAEPVGVWEEMREDERGLYCRGRLLLDVERGRECYALLKAGAIDGLSIGYLPRVWEQDTASGIRTHKDVDLMEVSPVTFPANSAARVVAVKSDKRMTMTETNETEMVPVADLRAAQAEAMELRTKLDAAQPILALVGTLTAKQSANEQITALADMATRAAQVEQLQKQVGGERTRLVAQLRSKNVPPVVIRSLEAAVDAAGGDLTALRAAAESPAVKGIEAHQPDVARIQASEPANETALTDADRAEFRKCGITDETRMLAIKASMARKGA